jgi:hypothetical protein
MILSQSRNQRYFCYNYNNLLYFYIFTIAVFDMNLNKFKFAAKYI